MGCSGSGSTTYSGEFVARVAGNILLYLGKADANQSKTCRKQVFGKGTGEREQEWAGRGFRPLGRADSCVRRGQGEVGRRRFTLQRNSDTGSARPIGSPSAKISHSRSPTSGS